MSAPAPSTPCTPSGAVTLTVDRRTGRVLTADSARLPAVARATLEEALGPARPLACAAPTRTLCLPPATPGERDAQPRIRITGYWHDSLIEGPGRRSVAKLQGCPIRCAGCLVPESWDPSLGSLVAVDRLADALLDPKHGRDGISIVGGEPFAQPEGLLALVRALHARGCRDILCYTGFTFERLHRMAGHQPAIGTVLDEISLLIDGPFVAAFAEGAGPWTGSGNQRVIDLAATRRCGKVVPLDSVGASGSGARRHGS